MRPASDSDDSLLVSGDPADFGRFYDRHVRTLLGYFQRRTGSPEAAADLTAETFAAALAARRRFEPRATPASVWLFSIAHHKLIDYRRRGAADDRMQRRLRIARLPVGAEDSELIRLLGDEVAIQLVDELPDDQRDAVRAHVLESRGYAEIARSLDTSEATVRKRVSRGLNALRSRAGGDT
jgi:RNA polymerase sigma factor (sigma-70 family)